jgi:hypothetical protein
MSDESAIWLYAVTRDAAPELLDRLAGVAGGPVRLIEAAGLAAMVGDVPLAEFDQEPLARNLENLTWLEPVARAHHEVVARVARFGPVVPTRLATIYRDAARVAEVLAARRADFSAALDRVDGRAEWGVKVYAVPGAVAGPAAGAGGDGGGGGDRPGLAYLRRRQAQLSRVETAQRVAVRSAEQVHELLARQAEVARRHTPHDRRLSGKSGVMVLNGAYLARSAAGGGDFVEAVRTLAGEHPSIRLELTGPWPPYSFAAVETAGEAAADDGQARR